MSEPTLNGTPDDCACGQPAWAECHRAGYPDTHPYQRSGDHADILRPVQYGGFLCNTDALTGIDKDPYAKETRWRKGGG